MKKPFFPPTSLIIYVCFSFPFFKKKEMDFFPLPLGFEIAPVNGIYVKNFFFNVFNFV